MSGLGHKQTLRLVSPMSALPPKADIDEVEEHVRFVPKADIAQPLADQGFGWGKNDMLTL